MLILRASILCYQLQWDIPASEGLEDSKGLNNEFNNSLRSGLKVSTLSCSIKAGNMRGMAIF